MRKEDIGVMEDKRILLHTCCAPCLLYPYRRLVDMGYDVVSYWYNPNIYPVMERVIRFRELERYCSDKGIEFVYDASPSSDFFSIMGDRLVDSPSRCSLCWAIRLENTAKKAHELGIKNFTTTLLVSRYQDPQEINRLGKDIARDVGISYLAFDFRDGFDWAHQEAKRLGMYRQRWCGCIYSFSARARALFRRGKYEKIWI